MIVIAIGNVLISYLNIIQFKTKKLSFKFSRTSYYYIFCTYRKGIYKKNVHFNKVFWIKRKLVVVNVEHLHLYFYNDCHILHDSTYVPTASLPALLRWKPATNGLWAGINSHYTLHKLAIIPFLKNIYWVLTLSIPQKESGIFSREV